MIYDWFWYAFGAFLKETLAKNSGQMTYFFSKLFSSLNKFSNQGNFRFFLVNANKNAFNIFY